MHAWLSGRKRQTHNLFSVRTSQVQILLHAIKNLSSIGLIEIIKIKLIKLIKWSLNNAFFLF